MKNRLFPALGLALCFLLSGCVVDSDNPLSSPESAKIDQRLLGDWIASNGDHIHFSAKGSHWMQMVSKSNMSNEKPDVYDMFVTTIGKKTYMNVRMKNKDGAKRSTTYLFYRYRIVHNESLYFSTLSEDEMEDFVDDGRVKGTVHEDNAKESGIHAESGLNVHLTDSSENLVRFLMRHGDEAFADEPDPLTRVRTKD